MMYGIIDETGFEGDYEERVENSFDKIFTTLEKEFQGLDRENEILYDTVSEFAIAHDEAYFEKGFIMGLKIYKSIEEILSAPKEENHIEKA